MNKPWYIPLIILLLGGGLPLWAQISVDNAKKIAEQAEKKVDKALRSALKSAKKEGGSVAMAKYCIDESRREIEAIDREMGEKVHIKRISLNYRDTKNAPKKGEETILRAFELLNASAAFLPSSIVQVTEAGNYKVYVPITMQSRTCKSCHGAKKRVDKKVADLFDATYKDGGGYGHQRGDLRGALVVDFLP